MTIKNRRNTSDKIDIYRSFFSGLTNVYGTYDPETGRAYQAKERVSKNVFLNHLMGRKPYGVYLLVKDRTSAVVADFDTEDRFAVMDFISRAKHYGISAYVERSKSKGYHAWIFFEIGLVFALKARLVAHYILEEIDRPDTEVFPKQNCLDTDVHYGNYINAPLFGALVPLGKTVFVDPATFIPFPDQWALLESAQRVTEQALDEIIELNDLSPTVPFRKTAPKSGNKPLRSYALPPCAQKILDKGVFRYQRVSCFRLAVHFKRLGLPYDIAIAGLKSWALKNQPKSGRQVIRETEILTQASDAYNKSYTGYGCQTPAIMPFCDNDCFVKKQKSNDKNLLQN